MKKEQDEINYWQSTTDILSALLLVIILVAVVLILYMMGTPKEDWRQDPDVTPTPVVTIFNGYNSEVSPDPDYGGGGAAPSYTPWITTTPSPTPTTTPTPTPFLPSYGGGGYGGDGGPDMSGHAEDEGKAAVYVIAVDEETDKVIPEEGLVFELLDEAGMRQTLNTYYPVREWFTEFTTTEDGVFYLPEKVLLGGYRLRTEMAPKGYDIPDDTVFEIDETYDWPTPYVVRIPYHPSKNVIRVKVTDRTTGEGLKGASFRVIAEEDILTEDETLRYKKGEQADLIVCDEEGNGESKELYLGIYRLEQEDIPEYYAGIPDGEPVEVVKKIRGREVEPLRYECGKTSIVLSAYDEIYPARKLKDTKFTVACDRTPGGMTEIVTDDKGQFILTDLKKDTVYRFVQTGAAEGYHFTDTEYTVDVDVTGRIDNAEQTELTVSNYLIRVSTAVRDLILKQNISDISVGLYDENDQLISMWSTQATAEVISGLMPGEYRLIMNGTKQEIKNIIVKDTPEIQEFAFEIFTRTDIGVLVGLVLVMAAAIFILIKVKKRK